MDSPSGRQGDELGEEAFPFPASTGQSPVESAMPAQFSIVKVFSATKSKDREKLGERVTAWIEANPTLEVVRTSVTQSSDHGFHCLTLILFCAARD
jgi:hypothetical protein